MLVSYNYVCISGEEVSNSNSFFEGTCMLLLSTTIDKHAHTCTSLGCLHMYKARHAVSCILLCYFLAVALQDLELVLLWVL